MSEVIKRIDQVAAIRRQIHTIKRVLDTGYSEAVKLDHESISILKRELEILKRMIDERGNNANR